MAYTEEFKKKVISLHKKGVSSRKICKNLGLAVTKKSTINNIIASWHKNKEDLPSQENNKDNVPEVVLDYLAKNSGFEVSNLAKRLRSFQKRCTQLQRIQREMFDKEQDQTYYDKLLTSLVEKLNKPNVSVKSDTKSQQKSNKVVEILWSDWQWGKVSESWNTDIAEKASIYYGKELLKIVEEVCPEKIIFTALGDNIEDGLKHGVQSAVSTDSSNAEQIANCIEKVWFNILLPLINTKIPIEFVGVAGNHGASEHKGMDMYKAGRYCMDYTLYRTWETLCKTYQADHVTFNLPEGHFATYEIYGKLTVAEHGYNCKGSSENAMLTLRNKRANNLQKFVHRLVIGDMHHYCNYDNGNLQVNGAAFGVAYDAIEYSGIMGFHAVPAQIVNIHAPVTGVGQNTVLETKVIQVAKGY